MGKTLVFLACICFTFAGIIIAADGKPWIGIATIMIAGANLILMTQ